MTTGNDRADRILLYGGAAGLLILTVLEAGLQITDSDDFWWGMAAGRYITQQVEIPRGDVFSHTFAGRPWINPEWLTHVLFYNVYQHLGENWVVYLRLAVVCSIFALTLGLCVARSKSWLTSLLVVAAGAWVCRPFLDTRPQLFTFLYSIILLYLLHLFRRQRRNRLYLIPLVMLIWTQQHGGYFFGLLLLLGNLLAESGKRLLHLPSDPLSWRRIRMLAAVTLISAAVMLLNPWTYQAFTHPLEMSQLVSGSNVFLTVTQEWLPPAFFTSQPFNPIQFWYFLFFAALAILPIAIVRWRDFDFNDVGLAAVLAIAFALEHRRFIPLFVILTLPLLSYSLKLWTDRWLSDLEPVIRRATVVGALAWLLFVGLLPFRLHHLHGAYAEVIHRRPGTTLFRVNTHQAYYPEQAVRFLRGAAPAGQMFNLYNWGGYLEFFLPEHKTFVDGRAQTVFDEPFQHRYLTARTGSPGWADVLEDHGATFALLHSEINAVLIDAMDRDPEWQWLFADGTSRLLFKRGPENRLLLDRFRARELPLPETGMTYYIYARQAQAEGHIERGLDDFRRACELSPRNDQFRAAWILALSSAGRAEAAAQQAIKATEELPESALVRLATARLDVAAGRSEKAYQIFADIFQRWPEQLEAVEGMLEIDLDRARSSIERVYHGDPGAAWRSYAMGRVAELEARRGDARRFYNAEGLNATRVGDQIRLLRSQEATDRILDRKATSPLGGE